LEDLQHDMQQDEREIHYLKRPFRKKEVTVADGATIATDKPVELAGEQAAGEQEETPTTAG
jgi:hypothetical protein